jgi:hypothetical protein
VIYDSIVQQQFNFVAVTETERFSSASAELLHTATAALSNRCDSENSWRHI